MKWQIAFALPRGALLVDVRVRADGQMLGPHSQTAFGRVQKRKSQMDFETRQLHPALQCARSLRAWDVRPAEGEMKISFGCDRPFLPLSAQARHQ